MSDIEKPSTIEDILSQNNLQDTFDRAASILAKQNKEISITKKQADELSVMQSFHGQGILGLPPICNPSKCSFADSCPIAEASRGSRCPIELNIMKISIQLSSY